MSNDNSSYRTIFKGTAIFGGVQAFNILINIIRGKFVALLLGPTGMGISSLFTSTANTISQFSGFGLNLGSIKEISEANEAGDENKLGRVAYITRKLILYTGILAATIAIFGASWLSKITFGNNEYTWEFVLLSLMLFFTVINNAEMVLLQGTRRLKHLTQSAFVGAATGLIAGVPLYYFFGTKGIVPAMVILSFVTFCVNRHYTKKLNLLPQKIKTKDVFKEGKQMISLGVILMISNLIGTMTIYIINIYIRSKGGGNGLNDIGLYQAATSITNQYIGVIFASMAADYLPRLAAISNDQKKVHEAVSNQLDIVMLIIAPLLIMIIVTAPVLIHVLLAGEFMSIIPVVRWLGLGIFFKALAFPIGYVSFAKGDKKTFFWLEAIYGNVANLLLSVIGYTMWGVTGLGIAFTISGILYIMVLLFVVKARYQFSISRQFLATIFPLFIALFLSFFVFQINIPAYWSYIISCIMLLITIIYSYKALEKRIGIKDWILSKFGKKK